MLMPAGVFAAARVLACGQPGRTFAGLTRAYALHAEEHNELRRISGEGGCNTPAKTSFNALHLKRLRRSYHTLNHAEPSKNILLLPMMSANLPHSKSRQP